MPQDRPTISTHVLDVGSGAPRRGLRVRLQRPGDDGRGPIMGDAETDEDGRIRDLLEGAPLETGRYRLEFALDPGGFFSGLTVDIVVDDAGRGYHVPLLLAPYGLTTYRGS